MKNRARGRKLVLLSRIDRVKLIHRVKQSTHHLRSVNAARMIHEMSTQASMYIPLSLPRTQLSRHLHLDRSSQWHISALLSAALESATLPTRLRRDGQQRGFVDDLEAVLNVNGNQRIAQLQCSMLHPEHAPPMTAATHEETDDRTSLGRKGILIQQDGHTVEEPKWNVNLSGSVDHVSDYVFGAVDTSRTKLGGTKIGKFNEDEIAFRRKRARSKGLSVIQRFVTPESSRACLAES